MLHTIMGGPFEGDMNANFFELYALIILTSTLVLGINYFVIITRPLRIIVFPVIEP